MRYNHFSMLPDRAFQPRCGFRSGGMTLEGGDSGGGGGKQPAHTTQVTIPEYAKPYMQKLLGKAEALTSSPYQAYGGERIAGSTPEQLAARKEVAGLDTPGQFGVGTGMIGAGGLGSLGYGQQAAGMGQQYFGMATDPAMTQMFMSPYQQAVTDVAKSSAMREAQIAQRAADLQAGRRPSALGSSASALGRAERERGLLNRLTELQATGDQKAFENAQKALQFGSTLGLQGLQTGLQGTQQAAQAGQMLGQIGAAEQAANLERLKAQESFGSLGKQEQQAALDLAYQDFLAQQQHPYKQLGFMSDLLRGSANLAGTGGKTVYEAPPSMAQQIVGPGLLGLGIYKEFFKG